MDIAVLLVPVEKPRGIPEDGVYIIRKEDWKKKLIEKKKKNARKWKLGFTPKAPPGKPFLLLLLLREFVRLVHGAEQFLFIFYFLFEIHAAACPLHP